MNRTFLTGCFWFASLVSIGLVAADDDCIWRFTILPYDAQLCFLTPEHGGLNRECGNCLDAAAGTSGSIMHYTGNLIVEATQDGSDAMLSNDAQLTCYLSCPCGTTTFYGKRCVYGACLGFPAATAFNSCTYYTTCPGGYTIGWVTSDLQDEAKCLPEATGLVDPPV
jgi:hypothetical protein